VKLYHLGDSCDLIGYDTRKCLRLDYMYNLSIGEISRLRTKKYTVGPIITVTFSQSRYCK